MTLQAPAELSPVDTLLEQTIRDIDIPPRPLIIERIQAEMRNDDANLKSLGQLIGADVSLAAGLIKTANSPYFGTRNRMRSVDQALSVLGLKTASLAIAGIALRNAFPATAQLERFWHTSAQIAALSGWLAQTRLSGKLRADDAYTYGLFRDAGIAIMLRHFPSYRETLASANQDCERPFTSAERQAFPTDHAMIGSVLALDWWLPEEISRAIRFHHQTSAGFEPGLSPATRYLIATSQLAEHLVQKITGRCHTSEWPKLGPICLQLLALTEDDLAIIYQDAAAILAAVD